MAISQALRSVLHSAAIGYNRQEAGGRHPETGAYGYRYAASADARRRKVEVKYWDTTLVTLDRTQQKLTFTLPAEPSATDIKTINGVMEYFKIKWSIGRKKGNVVLHGPHGEMPFVNGFTLHYKDTSY